MQLEEDSAVDWAGKDDTERCSGGIVLRTVAAAVGGGGALPQPFAAVDQEQHVPSASVSYFCNHSNTFPDAAKSVDIEVDEATQVGHSSQVGGRSQHSYDAVILAVQKSVSA